MNNFFLNFSQNPLYIRLAASLFLLAAFLICHRLLSRLVINLVSRIEIRNIRIGSNHLDKLQKPFNYLFLLTGLYCALALSPLTSYKSITIESFWFINIPISIIPFQILSQIYGALLFALITWIFFLLTYIYEEILNDLNIKLPFMDNSLFIRFTARLTRAAIVILGSFISLSCIFHRLPTVLTGVGIGGVAIAYLGKDTLSNIFSSFLLMLDKPFVIGDWIELIGFEGIVEDISFRSTRLRTFTQGQVVIPNAEISNANLINWTRMEKRRVKFELGVDYGTSINDLNLCISRIKDILEKDEGVENNTYLVAFENFGDYALNIQIIYYSIDTSYASYLQVKERINIGILQICKDLNITIAFPTQSLYIQNQ